MGELPKLFGKNFAIGFFIPAAALEFVLWRTIVAYGDADPLTNFLKTDLLVGATLAVFLVWLGAILLMALNRPLLRLLEGYGDWHPLQFRKRNLRAEFEQQVAPTLEKRREITEARSRGQPDPQLPENYAQRLRDAVTNFPDDIDYVLPTRFGNRMRAFEVYSRVIYGLDAIPAWPRLQAVLPTHFREMLDEAKAQLDFAINMLAGATVALVFYLVLSAIRYDLQAWWIPLACLIVGFCAQRLSLTAANQWGEYVKSAFDLYRAELAKQLGVELPRSIDAERALWGAVSRMMIFHSAAHAEELARFRPFREHQKRDS